MWPWGCNLPRSAVDGLWTHIYFARRGWLTDCHVSKMYPHVQVHICTAAAVCRRCGSTPLSVSDINPLQVVKVLFMEDIRCCVVFYAVVGLPNF